MLEFFEYNDLPIHKDLIVWKFFYWQKTLLLFSSYNPVRVLVIKYFVINLHGKKLLQRNKG